MPPPVRYVILDVDDVVVDTDEASSVGVSRMCDVLSARVGADVAQKVCTRFDQQYRNLTGALRGEAGAREAALKLQTQLLRWQEYVAAEGYATRTWSRDVLLAVALHDERQPVSSALLVEAVNAYWAEVTAKSKIHGDAQRLLETCRAQEIPVHFATNSDGFLRFDDELRSFRYHPEVSRARKLERLRCLADLGVTPDQITVGDPEGKPTPAFYLRALDEFSRRIGGSVVLEQTLAVGDSLSHDVAPFIECGVGRGAWLCRHGEQASLPQGPITRFESLDELRDELLKQAA